MHKIGEVRLRGFQVMQADRHTLHRQTDTQTDRLITIPCNPANRFRPLAKNST